MQVRSIGEVIRAQRLKLGLTQEQLCEGICEPATISRLENDKQSPSYSMTKALLQRLDLPETRYNAILDAEEMKLEALKEEASAREALFWDAASQDEPRLREKALEAVRALEDFGGDDPMVRQYAAGLRASLGTPDGPYSLEETLSMLLDALRITVPQFDLENISTLRYSREEMALIIRIVNAYALAGERNKVLDIYRQLVQYAQEHSWDQPLCADRLALILCNYAIELNTSGQRKAAVDITQQGLDICVKYNECQCLGSLLATQANACFHLGDLEKSKDLYYQAFYILKALGDRRNLKHLQNDAMETLKLTFT